MHLNIHNEIKKIFKYIICILLLLLSLMHYNSHLQILTNLEIYHPLVYFPKVVVKKQPSTLTYQSHPGSREGRNPRMARRGHPRDPQGHQDQGPKAHFHLPLTVSVSRICNRKSRLYRPFLLTLSRQ